MSTTYTESLKREIWNMAKELDENEDFSKVIDFLNSEEGFQPFGKRLAAFIAKTLQLNATDFKTIKDALKKQRETTGVDISEIASDGTLRNWFDKGTSRKKGDDTRRHMFALAFALRLSVDDTKKLFHKIFLDRALNYRNEKEVIYYFCLTKTQATAPNRHHLTVLRKLLRACVKKVGRNAADRKDIKEPILLYFPSPTKSRGICTPTVLPALIGISALQRLALRRRGT